MERYRDLTLLGSPDVLEKLRASIETAQVPGWTRDVSEFVQHYPSDPKPTVFEFSGGSFPKATVWLFWKSSKAELTNIVPASVPQLSPAQYNGIVETFARDILDAPCSRLEVEIKFGHASEYLGDVLSERSMKALQAFSGAANKATGNTHPLDLERWHNFVITSHVDGTRAKRDLLFEWLTQQGWLEDQAENLVEEYVSGLDLLAFYDAADDTRG